MTDAETKSPATRIETAKRLRKEATFPERLLWGKLRSHRLDGLKFRRQHPLGPYVLDFYCAEAHLAVEVDGYSHFGRIKEDARRTRYLESCGLKVVRFGNDDVLKRIDTVLATIAREAGG